jgi:hypothetical protein
VADRRLVLNTADTRYDADSLTRVSVRHHVRMIPVAAGQTGEPAAVTGPPPVPVRSARTIRVGAVLPVLVGVSATGVAWVRLQPAVRDALPAEDGTLFLPQLRRRGPIASRVQPDDGYQHLVPRALTDLAAATPVPDDAHTVTVLCCRGDGLVAAVTVVWSRDVLLLLLVRPRTRRASVLSAVVADGVGMSEIQAVLFLPLPLPLLTLPHRRARPIGGGSSFGLAVQLTWASLAPRVRVPVLQGPLRTLVNTLVIASLLVWDLVLALGPAQGIGLAEHEIEFLGQTGYVHYAAASSIILLGLVVLAPGRLLRTGRRSAAAVAPVTGPFVGLLACGAVPGDTARSGAPTWNAEFRAAQQQRAAGVNASRLDQAPRGWSATRDCSTTESDGFPAQDADAPVPVRHRRENHG